MGAHLRSTHTLGANTLGAHPLGARPWEHISRKHAPGNIFPWEHIPSDKARQAGTVLQSYKLHGQLVSQDTTPAAQCWPTHAPKHT